MVEHLSELEQDKVILSLVVAKGSSKFSRTKEELARKCKWHSREMLIEMFNDEVAMAEAIFNAMNFEYEVDDKEDEVVTPANMLPLIGTKWAKEVNQEKGGKEMLVKMIAKVLWRGYHEQAELANRTTKKGR